MEATPTVKAMVISAKQYQHKPTGTNLTNLLRQLDILISITGQGSFSPSDFCPRDILLVDCITCISDFLNNPDIHHSLRNKCIQLLVSLSHDEELGRCLHLTFDLTPVLTSIVVAHRPDTNDPLVLQCLEILQRITYSQSLSSRDHHITELCSFLIKQIQLTDHEPATPTLGLLANLTRSNPALQSHIKNTDHVKSLYKNLVRYLNKSRAEVVVYSQSILTSLLLDDASGEQLFNVKNINQTFEYVFNLLVKGQPGYLRAYTVDLLIDLIKSPRVQQALTCFDHIERSIQRVILLVESVKEKSAVKIFELLVEFCALPTLRSIITRRLFQTQSTETRDFVTIIAKWACVTNGSLRSTVLALNLLKHVIEDVFATSADLLTTPRCDLLLRGLRSNLTNIPLDHIKLRCQVMSSSLDLLLVLLQKDAQRSTIIEYIDASVCSQVLHFQYTHNTLGAVKYETSFDIDNPEDWSEEGVTVALHSLVVMDKLKRSSPDIQQLLHTTLLDARFTPLLAYGLTSTTPILVQCGINLVSMAVSLQDFPHIRLSETMAASVSSKTTPTINRLGQCRSCAHHPTTSPPMKRQCLVDMATRSNNKENHKKTRKGSSKSCVNDTDDMIESLISSFKSGVELKDAKVTEIIDVYEHKLQNIQSRYTDLEELLDTKMAAVSQADRLIGQHGSRMAQAEAEISQLRCLLRGAEKKCEESGELIHNAQAMRAELQQKLDDEQQRYESLSEELQELQSCSSEQTEELKTVSLSLSSLKEEHHGLTNIHDMLTKHHEALKQQHDVLKQQFGEVQDEKKNINRQLKDSTSKLQEHTKALKSLKLQHEDTKKERDEFEEITEKLRSDLSKADISRKKLEHQLSSLELVIRDKEKVQNSLHDELSKHAQIAALIHNLSSGNVANVANIDTSGISK